MIQRAEYLIQFDTVSELNIGQINCDVNRPYDYSL